MVKIVDTRRPQNSNPLYQVADVRREPLSVTRNPPMTQIWNIPGSAVVARLRGLRPDSETTEKATH